MSFTHWFAVAAISVLSFPAHAQSISKADPADPHAAVPRFQYESAFQKYQAMPAEQASPDKIWRAANIEVQGTNDHAGHIQEASGDQKPSGTTPASSQQQNHKMHSMSKGQ